MTRRALAVFRKEALEGVRDRRAAAAALVYSLVGPLVLFMVLTVLARESTDPGAMQVVTVGAEHAPGLEGILLQHGVVPTDSGAAGVRLDVPPDFSTKLALGERPRVTITADLDRDGRAVTRIQDALAQLNQIVVSQRLVARGAPTDLTRPFAVDVRDAGALDRRSRVIISAILLILITAPFFGGIALASDSTAGERERHSLTPLLAQPVHPLEVALGKWLAVSVAAALGSVATAVASAAVLARVPLADLGLGLSLGVGGAVVLSGLFIPLSLGVAAAQLLIALGSRTFKEGQTYLTLLSFLPFLVVLVANSEMGKRLAGAPIPLLWEMDAIGKVMVGQPVGWVGLALVLGVYALVTAGMLLALARQLRRAVVADA
ncbi:MAG: hypothetical protein AMXMBFR53_35420 [Gemmatimonadota bacterium]